MPGAGGNEWDTPVALEVSDKNQRDVVDPEVRGYIYSLVIALGGPSVEEEGVYEQGEEALACLKDLRRWLKLYDEKNNRYDVARCLWEMNLVGGGLLEIISQWKESETGDKYQQRLVLACLELLAPLTWPFDKNNSEMTRNHHRHIPVLKMAHASYKQALLHHRSGKILKDLVRIALPSIAISASDRTERDEAVIQLLLYMIRNIAMIEHPNPTETDTGEEIGRGATINIFSEQNVLDLLLTVGSGIGDEFHTQDVVVLEVLYHLIKGVDVDVLFMSKKQGMKKRTQDLTSLLKAEDDMKRAGARGQSTRHNRFGTTVWLERENGIRSFVPGQQALVGKGTGLQKLDAAKKWKKPRGADIKGVSQRTEYDMTVWLEESAKEKLREFVENFLDAGFNPLFNSIRRAIERDVDRLLNTHTRQFFYLVAWFLKAERVRRHNAKSKGAPAEEDDGFGVVAAVLNHETLITLNRKMMEWYDLEQTREVQSTMRCLTQILYTVQDMALSPIEDDQDIAENIQSRLFYEEATMDLLVSILKSYTKQPFSWLDDCTEMVHVHLKILEKYSEQHEHMFVRAKRRSAKAQQQKATEPGSDEDEEAGFVEGPENDTNEADAVASHAAAIRDRKFDFSKYEAKFTAQPCLATWVAFLHHYRELSAAQLMRAIKYLHRIFEKRHDEVLLFRIDIVNLFYQMMQGSSGNGGGALPRSHAAWAQTDQFVRRYLRRLTRKLEKQPELFVELLFTKLPKTVHFLQHGEDPEFNVRVPKPAAELEVRPGMSHEEQIGVAVSTLIDGDKADAVEWLKSVFTKAVAERKSWEAESIASQLAALERGEDAPLEDPKPPFITIHPDSDERKKALFKDAKLRLLLRLCGAEPLDVNETPDTVWILPSALTGDELAASLALLKKFADDPPTFADSTAAQLLRRKPTATAARRRAALESDSEGNDDDLENFLEFEPGGPTVRKPDEDPNAKNKPKKPRRQRRTDLLPLDEAAAEEHRRKRIEREKAQRAKIKSALRIIDSDDDSADDRAFFERERALRARGPTYIDDPPPPRMDAVRKDGLERWDADADDDEILRVFEEVRGGMSDPSDGGEDVDGDSDGEMDVDRDGDVEQEGRRRKRRKGSGSTPEDRDSSGSDSDPEAVAARAAARLAQKPKKSKAKSKPKPKPKPKQTPKPKQKPKPKFRKPRRKTPIPAPEEDEVEEEVEEEVMPPPADSDSDGGGVAVAVDGDGDTAMGAVEDVNADAEGEDEEVEVEVKRSTARAGRRAKKVVDSDDE